MKTSRSKLIPTVYSTLVKNTTQLRLKTPVLNVQSMKRVSAKQASTNLNRAKTKSHRVISISKSFSELTTTSPFIIVNKNTKNRSNDVNKVIDGNAVLSNFNVDDLTNEERRDMLANILGVIANEGKHNINEIVLTSSTDQTNSEQDLRKKSKQKRTKLLPVTKANNVRIVSSLDELTDRKTENSANAPIYVVLLPQNKKK